MQVEAWLEISDTESGPITIEAHKDWAPLGFQRFKELVEDQFFDEAVFFRVLPNFMAQFGIAANPEKTRKWSSKQIKDDPVSVSNQPGYVTFATSGKNTRSNQLFINTHDNAYLDTTGFSPFGFVTDGMDLVKKINDEYREKPSQGRGNSEGNAYFLKNYPRLSYIETMRIVTADGATGGGSQLGGASSGGRVG